MRDIEKIFKDKLTSHKVPVSEGVWASIESTLIKKKKKRRRAFYFFFMMLALLLVSTFGVFSYLKKNNTADSIQINQKSISNVSSDKSTVNVQEYNKAKNLVNPNEYDKNILNNQIAEKLASDTKSTKGSAITTTPNSSSGNDNDSIDNANHSGVRSNSVGSKKIGSHYYKENKAVQKAFDKSQISKGNNSKAPNNNLLQERNIDTKLVKESNINANSYKQNNIKLHFDRLSNFAKYKNNIPLLEHMPKDKFRLKEYALPPGTLNTCLPNTNHFFAELYSSADVNVKKLYGDDEAYLSLRNNSESRSFSFSTGLGIGYAFKNGASVKTGFNYSNINERLSYRKTLGTRTVITIDTIVIDGKTHIERDTTHKVVYGDKIDKDISFKLFDVPLIVGLKYRFSNHKLGMNIGVIFNVVSINRGYVLDDKGEMFYFDSDTQKDGIFKSNVGLSIYSSFSYSYVFNEKIDIFLEPGIRFYLDSFTKSSYPLVQKYNKFSLSFGLRYHFNKI